MIVGVLKSAIVRALLGGLVTASMSMTASHLHAQARSLDPALRARISAQAKELPRLRSLLISIDGELAEERYFNGARDAHAANLKSASKSLLSALVGIAFDRGYLSNVRDSIGRFFPEETMPKRKQSP